jgi:hypothetical protein
MDETQSDKISASDWAKFYIEKGFSILPLQPRSKEPNFKLLKAAGGCGPHGHPTQKPYYARQPTPEELSIWFDGKEEWDLNIGIVAGVGGLVILDIDREDCYGLFFDYPPDKLATWVARSSKGYHVYIKPPTLPSENIEVSGVFELKVHDKYVVAPPSIHPSGTSYRWLTDVQTIEVTRPTPEQWNSFIDDIRFYKRYWSIIDALSRVWAPEHRHNLSLWIGGALRKRGLSENDARKIIGAVCRIASDPEVKNRLGALSDTYHKPIHQIAGFSHLTDELAIIVGTTQAREIVAKIPLTKDHASQSRTACKMGGAEDTSAPDDQVPWPELGEPNSRYGSLENLYVEIRDYLCEYLDLHVREWYAKKYSEPQNAKS